MFGFVKMKSFARLALEVVFRGGVAMFFMCSDATRIRDLGVGRLDDSCCMIGRCFLQMKITDIKLEWALRWCLASSL